MGPDPRLQRPRPDLRPGAGGGGANFGGDAGLLRLFNAQVGGQIAWLLPLAGLGLVLGMLATRRAPRGDLRRAGVVLFGLWAAVHVAVFSFAEGTFHPYYVSALAPAVAVLAAVGAVELVRLARRSWAGVAALDVAVLGSAALALELLGRTSDAPAWAQAAVPVAAAVAVLMSPGLRLAATGRFRHAGRVAVVAAAIAVLAGPASYSVANLSRSLSGNNVLAGPAGVAQASGMGGGMGGRGAMGAPPSMGGGATPPSASNAGSAEAGAGGATTSKTGTSSAATSAAAGGSPGGAQMMPGAGGMGGSISSATVSYLVAHQGTAKYLLAATGSQTTASVIIQTGKAVVTIGGFSGSDAAPTVSELAQMVASGELRYVLLSGSGGGPGGGNSAITQWVQEHGTAVTDVETGSGTLYRVTA